MKLKNRIYHAVLATHLRVAADRAHSDGRAAQANEDVLDEVAARYFAEASSLDAEADHHSLLAGDVSGALRSVPNAMGWAHAALAELDPAGTYARFTVQGVVVRDTDTARAWDRGEQVIEANAA
jgi:hypothetical protein